MEPAAGRLYACVPQSAGHTEILNPDLCEAEACKVGRSLKPFHAPVENVQDRVKQDLLHDHSMEGRRMVAGIARTVVVTP